MSGYRFTADWFSMRLDTWRPRMASLVGRPGLRYLEVGTFEGRSLLWMVDHVLTAPDARATVVDAFYADDPEHPDYPATFRDNLARCAGRDKVTVLAGESTAVLRTLPLGSFDVVYLDAGHGVRALSFDLALVWDLLAIGGLLIIDDYLKERDRLPRELRPQTVVDQFLSAVAPEVEIVERDYQLFVRRVAPAHARATAHVPPYERDTAPPLGDWLYLWHTRELVRRDGGDRLRPRARLGDLLEAALRRGIPGRRLIGAALSRLRRRGSAPVGPTTPSR